MSTLIKPADSAAETAVLQLPDPPRPTEGPLRKTARVTRTTVVVLALLAAAGAGGNHLVRQRLADRAFVDAGTAVLSAEPILVGSADAGVITQTMVGERDDVRSGQLLARVRLTGSGTGTPPIQEVRAPAAGVVTEIRAAGAVARAGEPVVTMYDPAKLTFNVTVGLETLRKLRLGMRSYVSGPGLAGRVPATLASVKAEVPGGGDGRITVVLRPEPAALPTVRTLVPGLQFAAVVDTNTAPGGTPAVNSA